MNSTLPLLREIIAKTRCKPGWRLSFEETDEGNRLVIAVAGYDSARPEKRSPITVRHFFPVPDTTFNRRSWIRWLFEQCRRLENHELGEWFRVGNEQPFLPLHGPGEDPYTVHEFRDEIDSRTTQDGSIREAYNE